MLTHVWRLFNFYLCLEATNMETYIVSALKYRPQSFEEVVGQQAITKTLENAIEKDQLAQALLFCGPRGVGKTSCARILAKRINSQGKNKSNDDFAFNIFELDAASNNSVDDIRSLNEQVRIPPQVGTHKIYIIDEVHMLSLGAFNAFLKTLEEPPKHVIFILATTEKQKIIPTILSRCQTFDFKRISVKDCKEYLQKIATDQNIEFEESEKTDFNNPDFYRGPPKIDENLVLQKAKTCDTLDFGSWVISHIPKEYFDFNGHINTFTFEKISQMLKNAGFVNVRRTNIAESKVSQFNNFDKNPSRENISILVIGEPKNNKNNFYEIEESIKKLIKKIKSNIPDLIIEREDERFTSKLSKIYINQVTKKRKLRIDKRNLDKVSASLILESFLKRNK